MVGVPFRTRIRSIGSRRGGARYRCGRSKVQVEVPLARVMLSRAIALDVARH
jgi:hypothetical protein